MLSKIFFYMVKKIFCSLKPLQHLPQSLDLQLFHDPPFFSASSSNTSMLCSSFAEFVPSYSKTFSSSLALDFSSSFTRFSNFLLFAFSSFTCPLNSFSITSILKRNLCIFSSFFLIFLPVSLSSLRNSFSFPSPHLLFADSWTSHPGQK